MKAVILAGGLGKRLKPLIHDIPKPMAPIHGRPFLEFLVSRLVAGGITDIILSVGYMHEKISQHFGDGTDFQASIAYCMEETPLGTGGAVRQALLMSDSDDTLVLNGDTFAAVDMQKLKQCHREKGAVATMTVVPVHDATRFGAVSVSPEGVVTAFSEKMTTASALINAGFYLFNRKVLDSIPQGNVSLEQVVLPALVQNRSLVADIQDIPFIDIGVPGDYLEFCNNTVRYCTCEGENSPRAETCNNQ